MTRTRILALGIVAALLTRAVAAAAQTTLDFEYPPAGYTYPVTDGYGGFHWGSVDNSDWWGRVSTPEAGLEGWIDPTVCAHDGGSTCAFNDGWLGGGVVSFWRDSPFDFLSMMMGDYFGTGSVTVRGYLAGSQVFSSFLQLDESLNAFTFDWRNVDRVEFDPGATSGSWFLADDLTYSAQDQSVVPEPVSGVLLATGLLGIAGAGLVRRWKVRA